MKRSPEQKNIGAALLKVQSDVWAVEKNATNPHFRSSYANLEGVIDATREALVKNGLVLSQGGGLGSDGNPALITYLLHAPSGEWLESELPIVAEKNTAQGWGSSLSYFRRYSQLAILNLSQTDDDGESAGNPSRGQHPERKTYVVPFGKFQGKTLTEIPRADLENYITWVLKTAEAKKQDIKGPVAEFIQLAGDYLGTEGGP